MLNQSTRFAIAALLTAAIPSDALAQLPDPGFKVAVDRTALVVTDPQNDFLSPEGVTWGVVGQSVTQNCTVENIDALFAAAKQNGIPVFASPHYYYQHDHGWQFEGALETLMHKIGMSANLCTESRTTLFKTVSIDGLDIFYREAGPKDAPTILLLHGFPTSSHMFRNLIPTLSDRFHLIAPDYPGYGNSAMPSVDEFDYSFDRFADIIEKLTVRLGLKRYSLYVMDYGAPVGFRLAARHPERVETLIVQNGNAYVEGIGNNFWEPIKAYWKDRRAFDQGLDNPWWKNVKAAHKKSSLSNEEALRFLLTIDATKWQYTNGARNPGTISPDNWHVDQRLLDRPGNQEIQLQMFYDYGSNPPRYPEWQAYFRKHQPPTLIVWGKNDEIFPAAGAFPYMRDLKNVEFHLLDTGHFALEEDGKPIADYISRFLSASLTPGLQVRN